jgi:hypothetical protein
MIREVLFSLGGVVLLAYGIDFLFGYFDDPREPRRVNPTIPVIGHILGIMYYGFDYYDVTR